MDPHPDQITAHVAALAACASLNLSPDRLAAATRVLAVWLPAANELSRKMSAPAHQTLLPITAFAHVHATFEDMP